MRLLTKNLLGVVVCFLLIPGVGWGYSIEGDLVVKGDTSSVGKTTLEDSSSISPLNVTERSSEPSAPQSGDLYLDDGGKTASGDPGWRRYTGAAWEDVSAASGGGMTEVADDTSPTLGGDLDTGTWSIITLLDRDLYLTPNGTGILDVGSEIRAESLVLDTVGSLWVNLSTYATGSNGRLNTALTAIGGSTEATILVDADDTLTTSDEVTANISLRFVPGNIITIATGVTLTISGVLDAPLMEIFTEVGTGAVSLSVNSVESVYSEWWGADSSDSSDDTAAIQSAIDTIELNEGGTLQLLEGTYTLTSALTITSTDITIKGMSFQRNWDVINDGWNGTIISQTGNASGFIVTGARDWATITIRDMVIYRATALATASATTHGILIDDSTNVPRVFLTRLYIAYNWTDCVNSEEGRIHCNDVQFKSPNRNGLRAASTDWVDLRYCSIIGSGEDGIYALSGVLTVAMTNCESFFCGLNGADDETDYYAVKAKRVDIRGGYFNNDHNELYAGGGRVVNTLFEYAGCNQGTVGAGYCDGDDANQAGKAIVVADLGASFAQETLQISNCTFYSSRGNDIYANENGSNNTKVIVSNCNSRGAGAGEASTADTYSIYQGSSGPSVFVTNSNFDDGEVYFNSINGKITNSRVNTSNTSMDGIVYGSSATYGLCTGNSIGTYSSREHIVVGAGASVIVDKNNLPTVVTSSTPYDVKVVEAGATLYSTYNGSTVFNLPEVTFSGIKYTFIIWEDSGIIIHPYSGDKIGYACSGACVVNERITSSDLSGEWATITLIGMYSGGAGYWYAESAVGTWTNAGT